MHAAYAAGVRKASDGAPAVATGTLPSRAKPQIDVLTIRLFGHARLDANGAVRPLRVPAKALQAFGYLATHHDSTVSRDVLAATLWPDNLPQDARANLRRQLHLLVAALPKRNANDPYLDATMHAVRWNDVAGVTLDVAAFARAATEGRYEEAIALYSGEFLQGHDDDWILAERERFRAAYVEQLQLSLRYKRSERNLREALAVADRIVEVDAWREDVVRIQMLLRSQLGDRAGALSTFKTFERRLADELDAEPTAETRAMFDAIARDRLSPDGTDAPHLRATRTAAATLPFVGREAELEALTAAWASAASGTGAAILVSGEAGAGKSRLCHELGLHVESQGGGVLVGTTPPGEERPYEAVVDALRGVLPLLVPLRTPAELGVLSRILPEIAARADVLEPAHAGAVAERTRTFEAIYQALRALSQKRPLLVVLEDLHWATATTIALFEFLARRIRELPVLVVATYREEAIGNVHPLRTARRQMEAENVIERVVLSRFERPVIERIARNVAKDGENVESLTEALHRYSEGIPLFLDEAVNGGGANVVARRLNVPERMQQLSESALALLEIAAVAGVGFQTDLLGAVAGWPEAEILQALDELVEARFVRQGKRRRFGDYAFSHHLVHAAVYERFAAESLRVRHLLVARALERLHGNVEDRAAEIALHYERGGDALRAARSYAAAAKHALRMYSNEEALSLLDRALEFCEQTSIRIDLQTMRAWAAQWLGRPEIVADALERLDELDVPPERALEIERLKTINALSEGRLGDAHAAARRYLRAALINGDERDVFQAHVEMCSVVIAQDRYARAEMHIRRATRLLPLQGETAALRLMRMQTWLLQRRGLTSDEMANAAQWLLTEARRVGDPQTEAEAHLRLAHVAMANQRFADAFQHYDAAREAYRRFGSPRWVSTIDINAGNLALWSADYAAARTLYERCLAFGRDSCATTNVLVSGIGLTLADIYCGRLPQALATLESVEDLARDKQTHEGANWHLCRALIAAERGDRALANDAYDAALAVHRRLPAGVLYALTLGLAALSALDDGDDARASELGAEVLALPEELLDGEEFPHLMLWAKARVARTLGDEAGFVEALAGADRLYRARLEAIGPTGSDAYAAVPWNARFLIALERERSRTLFGRDADSLMV